MFGFGGGGGREFNRQRVDFKVFLFRLSTTTALKSVPAIIEPKILDFTAGASKGALMFGDDC
jgi:hypothetical protein